MPFRSFKEAREFVRSLNLKKKSEWESYYKSEKRPLDIPTGPAKIYKEEWVSFGDWLGTRRVHYRDREYLLFEEARSFVRLIGLKSQNEWNQYTKSNNKPDNIPGAPSHVYKDDWVSWGDWLGTGTIATLSMEFLSFEKAKAFVRSLNLKSQNEWKSYRWTTHKEPIRA